jgi:hypothetical protein
MSDRDIDWTPDQSATLRSLRSDPEPPAELEERVVAALRQRGELGEQAVPGHARARPVTRLTQAAGLAAAMIVGLILGRATGPSSGTSPASAPAAQPASPAPADGPAWLLLLRAGPTQDDTPEAALVAEYTRWFDDLARDGRVLLADALEDSVRLVGPLRPDVRQEDAGRVQGFFLVRAADAEQALRTAAESPHVAHGGFVEVRAVRR